MLPVQLVEVESFYSSSSGPEFYLPPIAASLSSCIDSSPALRVVSPLIIAWFCSLSMTCALSFSRRGFLYFSGMFMNFSSLTAPESRYTSRRILVDALLTSCEEWVSDGKMAFTISFAFSGPLFLAETPKELTNL